MRGIGKNYAGRGHIDTYKHTWTLGLLDQSRVGENLGEHNINNFNQVAKFAAYGGIFFLY